MSSVRIRLATPQQTQRSFQLLKGTFFISLPQHHPLSHWPSKTYNKGDLAKVIQYIFHKQELVANGRLLLRFHDTLPLSANCMPATLRASNSKHTRLPCRYPCARMQHNRFCLVFSKNINIKSAYSVHQWPTLPQKIDSREGWFQCKKGWVVNAGKMNSYLKTPSLAPNFGLFAAKWSAFWCKTQCNLLLNAVRFDAKCNAFWC